MEGLIIKFDNLEDTVNKYLYNKGISSYGRNIKTDKPDSMYYTKIKAFESYLLERKKLFNNNQWLYTLVKLKPEDIRESMEYYIDKSRESSNSADHVKKKCVLENYRTVIYEYFKFLSSNEIKNIELINTFDLWDDDPETFKRVINKVAKDKDLVSTIKTTEPIQFDEFEALCQVCDSLIKKLANKNLLESEFHYKKYLRSIVTKVLLYTGIKYKVIETIKTSDLDINHNTIIINDFMIHLPNNLSDQLSQYLELRNKIIEKCVLSELSISDKLFILLDGSTGKPGSVNDIGSNSFLTGFLETYIGRNDISGVSKFVIIGMIEKGVNQSIIQNFTGNKEDIYNFCQDYVNKRKDNYEKSRYLDSRMRSIETFDIL